MTRHIYHPPWLTHLPAMLPVKKDEWWKEKETDLFYPEQQTGISWQGVSLTELYTLRNINTSLNLYMLELILFLFLSLLLVPRAYALLAFLLINYFADDLTDYLFEINDIRFTRGVSGAFIS